MSSFPQPSASAVLAALKLVMQDLVKPQSDLDPNGDAIQAVDAEIECLIIAASAIKKQADSQVIKCRQRRNLIASPILRLPDEMISEILLYTITLRNRSYDYRCLCGIRLVCSRLHQVSDASSRLWTWISDLKPAPFLLKKSRNASLHISAIVHYHQRQTSPLLDMVFANINRWQTFKCIYTYSSNDAQFSEFVDSVIGPYVETQAPLLREFAVKVSGHDFYHTKRFNLLGGFAPCLRRLDIGSITISWNSPLLSGLTFLRIAAWDGTSPPTREQYIQVLLSCPALEEVHFIGRDVNCTVEGPTAIFHSAISLPALKTLSLNYLHPTTIRSLLLSIQANPVALKVMFPGAFSDQWKATLDATVLDSRSNLLPDFNTSLNMIRFTDVDDDLGDILHIEAEIIPNGGPPFTFTCGFKNVSGPHLLYHTFFPPSVRAAVQNLTIEISDTIFNEDFSYRQLFQELVGLKTIHLNLLNVKPWIILSLLSTPVKGNWLCPQLQQISFFSLPFDINDLWKFLEARYEHVSDVAAPVRMNLIEVLDNDFYESMDDIPMGIAAKIASIVGRDRFVWERKRLNPTLDNWIEF